MHIWDTYRIALHPDGCNAILFYSWQTLKPLANGQRVFLPDSAQDNFFEFA